MKIVPNHIGSGDANEEKPCCHFRIENLGKVEIIEFILFACIEKAKKTRCPRI